MALSSLSLAGKSESSTTRSWLCLLIAEDRLSKNHRPPTKSAITNWWSAGRENIGSVNFSREQRQIVSTLKGCYWEIIRDFVWASAFDFSCVSCCSSSLSQGTPTFTTTYTTFYRRSLNLLMQAGQPSVIGTPSQYHNPPVIPLYFYSFYCWKEWME